jgi:LysM repeat protein
MMKLAKRVLMVILVLVILIGGSGFMAQPAQAASCTNYHTVRAGESLSWIGRYYGVNWLYLAQINQIAPPKYIIFPGQVLCIASGGQSVPPAAAQHWNFSVVKVEKDTSVRIRTSNFPSNVLFEVSIGRLSGNKYEWIKVADLDSDKGGAFGKTFDIPAQFAGSSQLLLKVTQSKKNVSVKRWFSNTKYGTGGIYTPPGFSGIPTIWIASVVRNSTVTIQTRNFPAGLKFDVLMGPMGTKGVNGYYVGTIDSGAGGSFTATFNIPVELLNHRRIAIRTQNLGSGFFSYNWFYNNTAY